jgi:hypothetical protein
LPASAFVSCRATRRIANGALEITQTVANFSQRARDRRKGPDETNEQDNGQSPEKEGKEGPPEADEADVHAVFRPFQVTAHRHRTRG